MLRGLQLTDNFGVYLYNISVVSILSFLFFNDFTAAWIANDFKPKNDQSIFYLENEMRKPK